MKSLNLLATVMMIALKVTGVIAWSWWIVTLPLWIGPAVWVVCAFVGFILLVIGAVLDRATK